MNAKATWTRIAVGGALAALCLVIIIWTNQDGSALSEAVWPPGESAGDTFDTNEWVRIVTSTAAERHSKIDNPTSFAASRSPEDRAAAHQALSNETARRLADPRKDYEDVMNYANRDMAITRAYVRRLWPFGKRATMQTDRPQDSSTNDIVRASVAPTEAQTNQWGRFLVACVTTVSESDARFYAKGERLTGRELAARMKLTLDTVGEQAPDVGTLLLVMTTANAFQPSKAAPYEVDARGGRIRVYDWLKESLGYKALPGEP